MTDLPQVATGLMRELRVLRSRLERLSEKNTPETRNSVAVQAEYIDKTLRDIDEKLKEKLEGGPKSIRETILEQTNWLIAQWETLHKQIQKFVNGERENKEDTADTGLVNIFAALDQMDGALRQYSINIQNPVSEWGKLREDQDAKAIIGGIMLFGMFTFMWVYYGLELRRLRELESSLRR